MLPRTPKVVLYPSSSGHSLRMNRLKHELDKHRLASAVIEIKKRIQRLTLGGSEIIKLIRYETFAIVITEIDYPYLTYLRHAVPPEATH